MFDVLFFYYYELPRFISRKENIHMPFVGTANPPPTHQSSAILSAHGGGSAQR